MGLPRPERSTAWAITTTLGFPTDCFIGWLVWSLNLTSAKSFERGRQHSLILCWQHTATSPRTRQEFKKGCGLLSCTQSWLLGSDLRRLNSGEYSRAIKAWFDLGFRAATAQTLCILLRVVPPLYGFFWLPLLTLCEEAEWGQFIAWKNIRPEELQL